MEVIRQFLITRTTINDKTKSMPSRLIIEDVLTAFKITPAALAKALKISPSTVSRIISGKMGISADLALRAKNFRYQCPLAS